MKHEPSPLAILAARIMRAYPSLSPYSAASLATELSAIERAQRRHAERCCSGADGGYIRTEWRANCDGNRATTTVHDPAAEERAGKRIATNLEQWRGRCATYGMADGFAPVPGAIKFELQGDPRGRVLLVRFPGESEATGV